MKYLCTLLISFTIIAYGNSTPSDLGVHIVGSNSIQNADRLRALLKSDEKTKESDSFLDILDTQSSEGLAVKASDTTYNSSTASARIDSYIGDSSVVGMSIGGVYTEIAGNTIESEDVTIMANLYGATKASSMPLGAFVDLSYANFLGSDSALGTNALSALGGIAFTLDTNTSGLTYSPIFMLNSLYLSDATNSNTNAYNALKMMIGIELDYQISKNYTASLRGLYNYDFKDTASAYNYNSLTGSYTSLGEVGNESLHFGAGLNYNFNEAISAGLDYSIYLYNKLISNNISIKIDLSF